ncbi:adenosine kinase [Methyloraptor flagellatus]|uniref:Adenosine kinase n=1 Tax=Methyloraptor flagellatus TaxID=3162530 RepID=A0AAU7X6T4_9HYPH
MSAPRFDVLGIGNAIVDIIARTEDDFILREGLAKGSMRLIDSEEAERLYGHMPQAIEMSGGCAGNTAAGVASFGGRAAFIGKVADDHLGGVYAHDIRAMGIHFATAPLGAGVAPTARSMILVTPDGERTMNTYLGACQHLTEADIDATVVAATAITYLEGYLWDPPEAKKAFRRAAEIAHANGREVAITLSDSFCVDRYRAEFLELIRSKTVDIVFANVAEVKALYETADFDTAIAALRQDAKLAAVTMSEKGSMVVTADQAVAVPAQPVETVFDTTGAGDLYAAGFLFGYSQGFELAMAAQFGGLAAAEIISHLGARPQVALRGFAEQAGFTL